MLETPSFTLFYPRRQCSSVPAGRRPGRIPRRCCGCKRAGGGDLPETSLGLVWKGREVAYQALDPDLVVVVDVVVQELLEVLMVLVIRFLTALHSIWATL